MTPLLLVTGGLGRVAQVLRPRLAGRYRLRLVDRVPAPSDGDAPGSAPGLAATEELVTADLGEPDAADRVLDGVDAVLHLAGNGNPLIGWDEAYHSNVATTRTLLEAAAAHRVRRVVLASSLHVMGEYNRPEHWPVRHDLPPRPCCPYGVSKAMVEALGRRYAEITGASVICLRLGLTGWAPTEARYLGMWLSDDDAGELVRAALTAPVRFGTYYGVSANTRHHWDTSLAAAELGYHPRDDSEPMAAYAGPPAGIVCRLFGDAENPLRRERRGRPTNDPGHPHPAGRVHAPTHH